MKTYCLSIVVLFQMCRLATHAMYNNALYDAGFLTALITSWMVFSSENRASIFDLSDELMS